MEFMRSNPLLFAELGNDMPHKPVSEYLDQVYCIKGPSKKYLMFMLQICQIYRFEIFGRR